MSNSECIIEDGQAKGHMRNFVIAVLKGQKKEIDSVKAMEVGVTREEPNVLELDEYAEELSGVHLDREIVSASRKVEIDSTNRLEVYRKRPRSWATNKGLHVIPKKWADSNNGDAKRTEYRSRLFGKELKRWDPMMPGTFASVGPFECVMFILSKALLWKPGASENPVLGCFEGTLSSSSSEMAIELPLEEQVKGGDLGELLKSLDGERKAAHKWEKSGNE